MWCHFSYFFKQFAKVKITKLINKKNITNKNILNVNNVRNDNLNNKTLFIKVIKIFDSVNLTFNRIFGKDNLKIIVLHLKTCKLKISMFNSNKNHQSFNNSVIKTYIKFILIYNSVKKISLYNFYRNVK